MSDLFRKEVRWATRLREALNMYVRYVVYIGGILLVVAAAALAMWTYSLRFSATRIIAQCSHLPVSIKARCYTDHINDVLNHRGLKSALDLVASSYAVDKDVNGFCHSNMHDLGNAAYQQFALSGTIDLSPSASYCGYGFYHGFISSMIEQSGSLKQAVAFCAYVGKTLGGEQAYAEGSCYHGIGHGVTDGTDVSAWGDMRKIGAPGLAICRQFNSNDEFEARCASGVFNSINVMYFDPKYKLDVHNDPYALCRTASYDTNERRACYSQMNVIVSRISDHDLARMIAYAKPIQDPIYRGIAIQSNADLVFATAPYPEYPAAIKVCNTLSSPDERESCTIGLVDGFMEFGLPGKEYVQALSFCAQPEMTKEQTAACYNQVVAYAPGIYSPALQQQICGLIPAPYIPATCTTTKSTSPSSNI